MLPHVPTNFVQRYVKKKKKRIGHNLNRSSTALSDCSLLPTRSIQWSMVKILASTSSKYDESALTWMWLGKEIHFHLIFSSPSVIWQHNFMNVKQLYRTDTDCRNQGLDNHERVSDMQFCNSRNLMNNGRNMNRHWTRKRAF